MYTRSAHMIWQAFAGDLQSLYTQCRRLTTAAGRPESLYNQCLRLTITLEALPANDLHFVLPCKQSMYTLHT